jgi:hypothetical protein
MAVMNIPIPMLARPLDLLVGPPDPADRYTDAGGNDSGVWYTAGGRRAPVGEWLINPGPPGGPERLPWKRDGSIQWQS